MTSVLQKTVPIGPQNRPGSIEDRLGVNPLYGTASINRASLPPDLLRYADEFDVHLNRAQRQEARARREAEDRAAEEAAKQAAISMLLDGGEVPEGFAVVQHHNHGSISCGVPFGDGFLMIRTADLEVAASNGFHLAASWPSPVEPEPEVKLPPNALPAEPLAIVRHVDPTVTTDLGRDLGDRYRLVKVTDLKYLVSLNWQPTAWPAS